jgi:hypothetical protein
MRLMLVPDKRENISHLLLCCAVWERYNATRKALDASQSLRNFATQLQQFGGVSLASLRSAGKGFIANEIGLGGCRDFGCDGTTTPDIIELSKNAFNGQVCSSLMLGNN